MQTDIARDWTKENEEVQKLGDQNWFKPEADQEYIITFLDEGGEEYEKEFEDRVLTRIDFRVRVIDEQDQASEHVWSLTKGGKESLYGKLVGVFAEVKQASGVKVLVTAVGEGKGRRYLVKKPRTVK